MAERFRAVDRRRVETGFNAVLPIEYEAVVKLSDDAKTMSVQVFDPENDDLSLAQMQFDCNLALRPIIAQPSDAEIADLAAGFATICANDKTSKGVAGIKQPVTITPAMRHAGVAALRSLDATTPDPAIVAAVYRAMRRAAGRQ